MKSFSIRQLFESTPRIEALNAIQRNPLAFKGALNEAEFIDMRLSPQRSRVGILYDIRWCQNFKGSNTALVVMTSVGKVLWTNDEQARQRPWHACYGNWLPKRLNRTEPLFPLWTSEDAQLWASDPETATTQTEAPASSPNAGHEAVDPQGDYVLEFGQLSVSGLSAQIYIGHVAGMDGAPPDMGELSDLEIINGFPQWSSLLEVAEHHIYQVSTNS